MAIKITNEDTVALEGYFDGNNRLQFRYNGQELAANGDSIIAYHDREVRFTLQSPSGATVRATHPDGRTTVTWTPVSSGVEHTFAAGMTDPAEVEAEAEPAPPKNIFVDVKLTGGLPDT